ncbi:MAG TPA: pyridoxamine 5'-phosphate oxidase family protein [Thermoanaerobaculia bacterium]|nr:pyridoxamine 5'-phosphate oxidase family protein [Thermoanaerobaculia bacterium]HUM30883.1 pyridoxamine 5'-phosphate oxidase family protein [Thermoanaerobaculia bacterium]HXK69194.1 pyridoxamine 5'-phosphate oxidase family protein [Thermoanaerobaculia bacterium]
MTREDFLERINRDDSFGYLATLDVDQPRVRPIALRFHMGKLHFCTYTNSDKVSQILANPRVEAAWTFEDMVHIRVAGKARIVEDPAVKTSFLESFPLFKRYFPSPNVPDYMLVEMNGCNVKVSTDETEDQSFIL